MTVTILRPANGKLHEARGKDITASVAGALLGVHPYTTPYRLWAQKTGKLSEQQETRAQQRGTLFEPIAVALVRHSQETWQVDYPLGGAYWRDETARLGATPDAFAIRPDLHGLGVLQLKTVSEDAFRRGWVDPDTRDIVLPSWIAVQAIVEADLTGAGWAAVAAIVVPRGLDDLVAGLVHSGCGNVEEILGSVAFAWLALDKLQVHVIDVPIHPGIKRKLRAKVAEFWALVDEGLTPPIDWSCDGAVVLDVYRDAIDEPARLADPEAFIELVQTYFELNQRKSEMDKHLSSLKPQIIQQLGNAARASIGRWEVVARTVFRKPYQVAATQFRQLHIKDKNAPKSGRENHGD